MPEISYSGSAIKDLEQIGDYIAEQFKNLGGALNTVNKIQGRINTLNDFPLIGAPLSSIYGIATDYRFLVCGNYLVFYRLYDNRVLIDRILYGKRDYLTILFGDLPQDETE
jgi:addiction module RelE/StbE family toxin